VQGGIDSASALTPNIQSAAVNTSTGDIGAWNTATTFTTTKFFGTFVSYNGFGYSSGGCSVAACSSQLATTYFAYLGASNHTTMQKSTYERLIDTGSGNAATSITINGSVACGNSYTVRYKSAPTSLTYNSSATLTGVAPGVAQDIKALGDRYLFISISMDDSSCTNYAASTITDINVDYTTVPNAPTLFQPANASTDVSVQPEFWLASTAAYTAYLRYKIEVCSTSDCSVIVRTINQNDSQAGWIGQTQQSGTAYYGGASIVDYAIHQYQPLSLKGATQYWWRGYATAPSVSGAFSNPSAIRSFTTRTNPNNVNITSGVKITSGSTISP
jgi:hypothetical protein